MEKSFRRKQLKIDSSAIGIFLAGASVVMMLCILQAYSDIFHGTVYFLITGFYLLWLLRNYNFLLPIGLLVTAGIVLGYIFGLENGSGPLINRIFSIFIFWLAIRFTIRFQRLSNRERENRNQLHALFENVSEAILLVDGRGHILMGNPGAERIFGFSRKQLKGMSVEDLMPQRFREKHKDLRNSFVLNQGIRQIDTGKSFLALKEDGTEFPVELGLSTYYENDEMFVIAFVTDITRRKEQEAKILSQYHELRQCNVKLEDEVKLRTSELCRALDSVRKTNENLVMQIDERMTVEDRLRKSQALYKAVARNFPDGIIAILNNEMKYVFVEGRELTGFLLSGDSNAGGKFDGLHRMVLEKYGNEIRRSFEGEKITFEIDVCDKFYDVISTPIRDAERPASEVLIVIRNITRHKRYEAGLKKALEKEKQLNILKSRFVSNVSHEFRTPLSTILSSAFLLEHYDRDDAVAHRTQHVSRIRRSVNVLTELLEDFLSLEKLSQGKVAVHYSQFSLPEFLTEFVAELDSRRKSEQRILLDLTAGIDVVFTDRNILSNILNNLVSNAIKYSPVNGIIRIDVTATDRMLDLKVSDNGMGIPGNEQKHIFERFYRAHNAVNVQGTGLGLNLVRRYVNLLHGEISFTSVLNEGSTFHLALPLAELSTPTEVLQEERSSDAG
jgi:PAS domain S-box-containing protein